MDTVRRLAAHALSVHLKDFVVRKHPTDFRIEGVPLGEGVVDFPGILSILRESGVDPTAHVELYIGRREDEAQTLAWEEECVARSVRYAREELPI